MYIIVNMQENVASIACDIELAHVPDWNLYQNTVTPKCMFRYVFLFCFLNP